MISLHRDTLPLKESSRRPLANAGPHADLPSPRSTLADALATASCLRCQARFGPAERVVHSGGELYHERCFVCAQCFRPFPDGLFYEVRCSQASTLTRDTGAASQPGPAVLPPAQKRWWHLGPSSTCGC